MGYALAMGDCLCCQKPFAFNPVKVPSFRYKGSKEPICRDCMVVVNQKRVASGLEPFAIAADAYEACDEGELDYD
jgi:hypothetical protein